ncbi:DUF2783 domain-containing protein [Shimia sp. NS0008-38b]|uniref:DUF2783 domain-containing protein n=1 Tax=Shimia sp. NS0008-38b TaxID=3127653 RepID=UPI0031038322
MPTSLILSPNFEKPDEFYAALTAAHDGLGKEASDALNARLLLILANHIGEPSILSDALHAAQSSAPK